MVIITDSHIILHEMLKEAENWLFSVKIKPSLVSNSNISEEHFTIRYERRMSTIMSLIER